MKSATHCQLLLPAMFHELALAAARPPSLGTLLRFARRGPEFAGNDHAWRCHFFGVARQQDDAVAPFACLGEGIAPGRHYWLCANPVRLQLQRDSFILADGRVGDLSLAQAGQLVEALNAHFVDDGMLFLAPHANRWYLRLQQTPGIATHPLSEAIGQSVQRLLPQGEQALHWHQRLNEMQMLLHAHPVNQELEQQGELPVNSLWLWGGGVLAPGSEQPELTVWAQDAFTRGLAQTHGCRVKDLPAAAFDWPRRGLEPGEHLLVLNGLEQANLRDDARAWCAALERMETHCFAPLLAALRDGTLSRLDLHLAGTHSVRTYTITRADLFKFWRRPQPLAAYLE